MYMVRPAHIRPSPQPRPPTSKKPKHKPNRIAEGPVQATLSRSPVTDAPNIPFIVSAHTALNDELGTVVEGVKVDVYLAPMNGTSLANCSASERAAVAAQRCTVVSGSPSVPAEVAACTLQLPCQADLVLRACAVSFANGTAIKGGIGGKPPCSETPIGRNTSAWAASPWAFQPALQLLPDRVNHTLGSTAVLSFATPPYAGTTTGVLVWGNADEQRTKVLTKLSPGPNRVTVGPLGDECRAGCKVALVLAVGRRAVDGARSKAELPAVPISKLFDPYSPCTLSDSLELKVLGENSRMAVTVEVEGPGGRKTREGNVSVAVPLGQAEVTVAVKDPDTGAPAAGAQVTVVVVDRAILDLMPYDVKVSLICSGGSEPSQIPPASTNPPAPILHCSPARTLTWPHPLPTTTAPYPLITRNHQDLPTAVQPSADLYLSIKDINVNRASREALNITFAALSRRLLAEPWLPFDTTVNPSRVRADRLDRGWWLSCCMQSYGALPTTERLNHQHHHPCLAPI